MQDIKTSLRRLLGDPSGLNLAKIAEDAGIPYYRLYHFARGSKKSLDVDDAERLYRHLTGESFITGEVEQ